MSVRVIGDLAYVPLSRGLEATVDAADIGLISGISWCASKNRNTTYATATMRDNGSQKWVGMHRLITGAETGQVVDHIDGNGLNNTRRNLRVCTNQQNIFNQGIRTTNRSGYKGVHWNKSLGKWRAQIQIDGKIKSLGCFDDVNEAAMAYRAASNKLHGKYARNC